MQCGIIYLQYEAPVVQGGKTVTEKQRYQAEEIAKTLKDVTDYQKTVISTFTEGLLKGIEIANQTKAEMNEKSDKKEAKKEDKQ